MTYQVKNIENEIKGNFESYDEALELVQKLGNRSELAFVEKDGARLYGEESNS